MQIIVTKVPVKEVIEQFDFSFLESCYRVRDNRAELYIRNLGSIISRGCIYSISKLKRMREKWECVFGDVASDIQSEERGLSIKLTVSRWNLNFNRIKKYSERNFRISGDLPPSQFCESVPPCSWPKCMDF